MSDSPSKETIEVACPDCGCDLVIDRKSGKVLVHKAKKAAVQDFDALLSGLDEQKAKAEEVFEKEKAALEDKDRILEQQFKEALKRAEETPDEEVIRPFDLD